MSVDGLRVTSGLRLAAVVVTLVGGLFAGCARSAVYKTWEMQLTDMPRHNGRIEDVSRLLRVPPAYCEPVDRPAPAIGVTAIPHREDTIVGTVSPGSPAAEAGLRPGDRIFAVAGQTLERPEELVPALLTHAREGEPLWLDTSRGTIAATPRVPKAEQCYWQLPPGQIVWMGGIPLEHPPGGAGDQPFFRASCRAHDGVIVDCQSAWRE